MAHFVPAKTDLQSKFNRPIARGSVRKHRSDQRSPSGWIGEDGAILEKPIQIYRMWYRFLQLALELEKQEVQIVTRQYRAVLGEPRKDIYGHVQNSELRNIVHPVVVNEEKYVEWDLDAVRTTPFDVWWKSHRHLFFDVPTRVIRSSDDWDDDPRYLYVQIDLRKRSNDILNDVRRLLSEERPGATGHAETRYPINGQPQPNVLVNRYNALILKLTTKMTDIEILDSEYFRATQNRTRDARTGKTLPFKWNENASSIMREQMRPAKRTLLSVCDGFFVNNPENTYLESSTADQ